jgi:ketosteroid isomerase-like protein
VSATDTIRSAWGCFGGGDTRALEAAFAPDARWRAVEDGPWNCESRAQILDVLARQSGRVLEGKIEAIEELGDRAIVAFRPAVGELPAWPLEDGVRNLVLTFRDGLIVEMKGCATRADAEAYAAA